MDDYGYYFIFLMMAIIIWSIWYAPLIRFSAFVSPVQYRVPLLLTPLACAVVLYAILRIGASSDVRNDGFYLQFYVALGAAWVALLLLGLPYFGLSAREDVLNRRNNAAAIAIAGAIIGLTLCYAGGNIGEGPGWWVVAICAALSSLGLIAAWFILETLGGVSTNITIERDMAAGLRLAGFLIAVGIVMGRAVAGDWLSLRLTLFDFVRYGWPALIILALAVLFERRMHATIAQPVPPVFACGVLPAALYLACALVIFYELPWLFLIER